MMCARLRPGAVAVVTGASRGIGASVARDLARAGASVILVSRSGEALEAVSASIRADGGMATAATTDVSRFDEVLQLSRRVVATHGTVDILINNAAVGGPLGPVWELDPAAFAEAIAVNLTGAWHVLRAFVPPMLAQDYGRIVAISSSAALRDIPTLGAYCASKAGFEHLHRVAAAELAGTGVRLNIVWPGAVDTELQGMLRDDAFAFADAARSAHRGGRLRTPNEVAPAIVELCAEDLSKHGELVDVGQLLSS